MAKDSKTNEDGKFTPSNLATIIKENLLDAKTNKSVAFKTFLNNVDAEELATYIIRYSSDFTVDSCTNLMKAIEKKKESIREDEVKRLDAEILELTKKRDGLK